MSWNYRNGDQWNSITPKAREGGEWVTVGGGGGGGGSPNVPDDATAVSQSGGSITGVTPGGTEYTGSSLDTVIEDISSDVNGAIAIEGGTYPWTGMCTVSSNTDILGDGTVDINVQNLNTSSDTPAVEIDEDDISFQNLNFYSDGTAKDCISRIDQGPRRDNIEVLGCEFHDFDNRGGTSSDVHVINADNWYDSVIENCTLTGVGYSAIRIHAGGEEGAPFYCRNNTIELPPDAQMGIMSDSRYSFIQNNHITLGDASGDPSYAIRLQDRWADYDKQIWIEGNTIEADPSSTDSNGIAVPASRFYTLDVTDNNSFYGLNQGVSGNLQSGTNITGNTFEECDTGITSSDSTDVNVSSNEFINCGTNVTF